MTDLKNFPCVYPEGTWEKRVWTWLKDFHSKVQQMHRKWELVSNSLDRVNPKDILKDLQELMGK